MLLNFPFSTPPAPGETREVAIARMRNALAEMVVEGIKTNIPLHLRILQNPAFAKADFYTKWIEEVLLGTAKA